MVHLVSATLLVLFLSMAACSGHEIHQRRRRSVVFACDDSETMVKPPFEYEKDVKCKDVIGRPPNRYKHAYRRTCQRWLGLDRLPDSVANTYVDSCTQYSNGTIRYKSKVCCFGATSSTRCFTCQNATNTYECTYGGQVVTCPTGQVCMTQSLNYRHNGYSKGYRFAICVPRDQCSALENANSQTCQDYIPSPNCTKCCSGPFCNYLLDDTYLWAYDDACKSNPCYNGGTCVLNSGGFTCICTAKYTGSNCLMHLYKETLDCQNDGILSYINEKPICYCPITKTGKECEIDAPFCDASAKDLCKNGGTCYDHTSFGSGPRCLCPPGWIGTRCEEEAVLECADKDAYYNSTYVNRWSGTYYNSVNCTSYKEYFEKHYYSSFTSSCKYLMGNAGRGYFVEGVNGLVGRLQSVSLFSCDIGDGLMRFRIQLCCPTCYSNPCQNGGWCQQNSDWDYVCQCRFGYEGRNCENKINMCIVSGDPHYKTLDGKHIHFQGPCKYNLLSRSQANNGLPDFMVLGRNERRGDSTTVSYPNYFEIRYLGYVIRLKKSGAVTVNGEVVYPDRSYAPHFRITKNGQFTRFESTEGLIVDYDGSWLAMIKVPDSYRGKVDGLCGNFDGDAENDMTTSGKTLTKSYAKIGNSWQVDDPDDPQCSGPDVDNPPECDSQTEQLVNSAEYCGLLRTSSDVFGSCLKKSGQLGEGFYESCRYDVCANKANRTLAKEAACAILSTVAAHCQSIQMPALWRTASNCPMPCPSGMVYKEKTSACAATCETPDGPEVCSYPDTENCVCPDETMVLINGTCQKPEMCRCPGGREIGSSWLSPDCSTRYECEACKDCAKRKVAKVYKYKHSCVGEEVCYSTDGVGKCEVCQPVNGGWASWSDWSDCNEETRLRTRRRQCDDPVPKCGGSRCSGEGEQTRRCIPVPASAVLPDPPSCEPNFDFQWACGQCDLFKNPNMYVASPCSCGTYYQCSKNQLFGYFDVYEMKCSPCTCWNPYKLTCDFDLEKKNPDHDLCTDVVPNTETAQSNGIYCSLSGRRFQAVPSNQQHYIDRDAGGIEMPCPPGTVFSVQDCLCIHGDVEVALFTKPDLCLEFDDVEHPLKNDQGIYVTWSKSDGSVLEEGVDGTALRFNGDRLEIPYYNNKEMARASISLWYKRDAGRSGYQTLVASDDCTNPGAAYVQIGTTEEAVCGGLTGVYNDVDRFPKIAASTNEWHHVVMTYDGQRVKFYLDGVVKETMALSGSIVPAHCPLLIGSSYNSKYFYGLMDKVCIFEDVLTDHQVKKMYEDSKPSNALQEEISRY